MEKTIMDILGWLGAVLYLVAYGLVSAKKVESDSWTYQGLNIVAGTMLIINTYYFAGVSICRVECRLGWHCNAYIGAQSLAEEITKNFGEILSEVLIYPIISCEYLSANSAG